MENIKNIDQIDQEKNYVILQPHERPKSVSKWITLSFQHVFAMFGANILVPLTINTMSGENAINISMALFCSGFGTLIYIALTSAKVPIYLGSSFSYMTVIGMGYTNWHNATFIAIFMVGVVYVLVGFLVYWTGIKWILKVFSPIVVGPIITVIGLSAISGSLKNMGILKGAAPFDSYNCPSWLAIIIGFTTFLVAVIFMLKAKSFLKVIPILMALVVGYIICVIIHFAFKGQGISIIDTSKITDFKSWEWYPSFKGFWNVDSNQIGSAILSIVPLSLVTMVEHLGDHVNVGVLSNKNYLKDPGMHRTLVADGVSLMFCGLVGGPANTTYAENTSVVGITKVASVWVTGLAAIFAICMSFIAPINQLVQMIPAPVLGGVGLMLFGMISVNGVRLMIDSKVDLLNLRNMIVSATTLAVGVGMSLADPESLITIGGTFQLSGLLVATVIGVLLNVCLPKYDNLGLFSMFKLKNKDKIKTE